jgi:hypothetical protein
MLTIPHSKTQTAIEYCWRFRDANPDFHVFWIYAGSIARFDADYRRHARKLGLPCDPTSIDNDEMRDRVKDWLNENENWLMVVDNADRHDDFFATEENDVDGTIQGALPWPRARTAMVIYTSRHDRVGAQLTDHNCLRLGIMSESEGIAMFRSLSGSTSQDEEVLRLLEGVDFLPLSIAHATAYLQYTDVAIDVYLSHLEASDEGLLDMLGQDIDVRRRDSRAPRSVVKAWQVSFDLLCRLNEPAANLFCLMACFDRQSISTGLMYVACTLDQHSLEGKIRRLGINIKLPVSQGDIWTALAELASLALINHVSERRKSSMHRYVQAITIQHLVEESKLLAFSELSALCISAAVRDARFDDTIGRLGASYGWVSSLMKRLVHDHSVFSLEDPHYQLVKDLILGMELHITRSSRVNKERVAISEQVLWLNEAALALLQSPNDEELSLLEQILELSVAVKSVIQPREA